MNKWKVIGPAAVLLTTALVAWPVLSAEAQTSILTPRVSVGVGGAEANDASSFPTLSSDGRYVAFRSLASNLVAGDANEENDIFVHGRETGVTTRVNVGAGGAEANGYSIWPTLSADGRRVAFRSWASNLVAGDTNEENDIFVHGRETGVTTRVNVGAGGAEANADSDPTSTLSADGRYVAFASLASNLVVGDTNGNLDVFVHDRQTGTTTRVSVGAGGAEANMLGHVVLAPGEATSRRLVRMAATSRSYLGRATWWRMTQMGGQTSSSATRRRARRRGSTSVRVASRRTMTVPSRRLVLRGAMSRSDPWRVTWWRVTRTRRVNVGAGGAEANADSDPTSTLSADGRYVARLLGEQPGGG